MRLPIDLRWILLTVVLGLAACASTPPQLVALPPAPAPEQPAQTEGASVLLRPVAVPGYLDAFPVVVRREGSEVEVARALEWAERFSDGVSRVLRDALARRLGPARLLISGDGRIPDADLSLEILRLDPQADGSVILEARWTLVGSRGERPTRAGYSRLQAPAAAPGASAVAETTAAALGLLADELAAQIGRFPPPTP